MRRVRLYAVSGGPLRRCSGQSLRGCVTRCGRPGRAVATQCRPRADRPFLLARSQPSESTSRRIARKEASASRPTVRWSPTDRRHGHVFYAYVMRDPWDARRGSARQPRASARNIRSFCLSLSLSRSLCRLSVSLLAMFIAAWRRNKAPCTASRQFTT